MIEQPTVFILGAGASVPYGFPTGYKLKRDILNIPFSRNLERGKLQKTNPNYSKVWSYIIKEYHEEMVISFFSELKKSGFYSVDAFLEHRDIYIDLGKTLISMELIKYEDENQLYLNPDESWYQYLYHNILRASFKEFSTNNVAFITFNYDRSLEQFFLNAIMNDYGKTEDEAALLMKSIPIIHLHGLLGNLPAFSSESSRLYNSSITPDILEICRSKIKIIHEGISEDEQFKEAHKLLSEAKQIWFLGFGYDKTNIERLNLPNLLRSNQNVFGTTFKMEQGEVMRYVYNGLNGKIELSNILDKAGYDNLNYLRHYCNHLL
jgi:hypothetical protein